MLRTNLALGKAKIKELEKEIKVKLEEIREKGNQVVREK
jgi:hypothetical protein